MARLIQSNRTPILQTDIIVPIDKGGTEATNIIDAVDNLGGLRASKLGQPNNTAKIEFTGKVNVNILSNELDAGVTLNGPTTVQVNQVANYTITNYSNFIDYVITPIEGSVSRTDDIISYTAPATEGVGGFVINSRSIELSVLPISPAKPTISSPVDGSSNVGLSITVNSSAFAMVSGEDTHEASDWQIATDIDFTTIAQESLNDTVNKISWSPASLTATTTYFLRVRYKGATTGYGEWSNITIFSTGELVFQGLEEAKRWGDLTSVYNNFGLSIAVTADGSRVVVGTDSELVFVLFRSGGSWLSEAKILSPDVGTKINFGASVAISDAGDKIIIGAPLRTVNSYSFMGSAYLFTRVGATWEPGPRVNYPYANQFQSQANFGFNVSISGDGNLSVIGAKNSSTQGAIFIYSVNGNVWTLQASFPSYGAVLNNASAGTGTSISITQDGTRIAVGAPGAKHSDSVTGGSVDIFVKTGSNWDLEATLTASDKKNGDNFGKSVVISDSGDMVLVGANLVDYGAKTNVGAVYMFTRSGVSWSQTTKISSNARPDNEQFGGSLSLSSDGNTLVVGAVFALKATLGDNGLAYVFSRSGSVWTQDFALSPADTAYGDKFGHSVAITGDSSKILVGAIAADVSSRSDNGVVYIFR